MHSVDDIIEQVQHLSPSDQQRLLDRLEQLLAREIIEEPRKELYARSLTLAGTVRSDFANVSADKYRHLAEAYAAGDDAQ